MFQADNHFKDKKITTFEFKNYSVWGLLDEYDRQWFLVSDVCDALNIQNEWDALHALDEDEKLTFISPEKGLEGVQVYRLVSMPGLRRLVSRSRKPAEFGKMPGWLAMKAACNNKNGRIDRFPAAT
jgi:prophage antirepressor-like protein